MGNSTLLKFSLCGVWVFNAFGQHGAWRFSEFAFTLLEYAHVISNLCKVFLFSKNGSYRQYSIFGISRKI